MRLQIGVGYKNKSFHTYLSTDLNEAEFCSEQESENVLCVLLIAVNKINSLF